LLLNQKIQQHQLILRPEFTIQLSCISSYYIYILLQTNHFLFLHQQFKHLKYLIMAWYQSLLTLRSEVEIFVALILLNKNWIWAQGSQASLTQTISLYGYMQWNLYDPIVLYKISPWYSNDSRMPKWEWESKSKSSNWYQNQETVSWSLNFKIKLISLGYLW